MPATVESKTRGFTPFAISVPAGPNSTSFDDAADAKGRRITGIDSMTLWVDKVVVGMQCTYTLVGGKRYRAPVRGAQTGQKHRITLEADEELIQLSARGNTGSINAFSLLSTKPTGEVRLHGPFGAGAIPVKRQGKVVPYRQYEMIVGGSDDKGFSWHGGKILAFTGRTRGGRLNGLGVLTAPIVEVPAGLRSTSVIAQDFRERVSGSKRQTRKLEAFPSYRSTVTVPEESREVTLWAEEQLNVSINSRPYVLDPVKPTKVTPNLMSTITINIDATDISVPSIKIRTDRMTDPWQWFDLHPDVAVHAKIAEWDTDLIFQNRRALGISEKYSKKDCQAVQAAVVNVAKLGLPEAGQAPYERKIDSGKMNHANWVLDVEGEKPSYGTLKATDVRMLKRQAVTITKVTAASGLFKNIKRRVRKGAKKVQKGVKKSVQSGRKVTRAAGKGVSRAVVETSKSKPFKTVTKVATKAGQDVSKVIVETSKTKPVKTVIHAATKAGKTTISTVRKAGGDQVVKSAVQLGKNVAGTGLQLSKDVARGDVKAFGRHLGQGGLQLGKDVTTLGKHVVVTVIKVGGEAVEYVLDRTVALGKLMWDLLKQLGAKIMKLVNFLLDLLPWKTIKHTQKQLMTALESSLARVAKADTAPILADMNKFFDTIRNRGAEALDKLTLELGGQIEPSGGVKKAAAQISGTTRELEKKTGQVMEKVRAILSKPLEWVNWLVNKLMEKIPVLNTVAKMLSTMAKRLEAILADIRSILGKTVKAMGPALGSSLTNLMAIVKNPADAPNYLTGAVLQLAKSLMSASLELVSELAAAVFRGLKALFKLFLDIGKLDLFPGEKKKGGKVPFITELYNFIVGGNLSIFKLITFLLAIPITLVHQVVFGSAPNLQSVAKRSSGKETGYLVAGSVCTLAELGINTFLDGAQLLQGIEKYHSLETGESQTFADKHPKAVLGFEVSSLICAALGQYFGNPYEFDPPPQDEEIADHVFYWIGVAQLGVDVAGLIVDQRRMARADLKEETEGREGAWGTLALETCILISRAVLMGVYKKGNSSEAWSGLLGTSGAFLEAGTLSFFPKSNKYAAGFCVASDAAFGLASFGTGLAADLK